MRLKMILFYVCIITTCFVKAISSISELNCKVDNGKGSPADADWFLTYKMWTNFSSFTISDSSHYWKAEQMNESTSSLSHTMKPLLEQKNNDNEIAIILWSNLPPYFRYPIHNTTSKGIIAWKNGANGLWITHTISYFPNFDAQNLKELFNQRFIKRRAAMVLCLTVNKTAFVDLTKNLIYHDPFIFFYKKPNLEGSAQQLFDSKEVKLLLSPYGDIKSPPYANAVRFTTASAEAPVQVAVLSKFAKGFADFYTSYVAKVLKISLRVWTPVEQNVPTEKNFCHDSLTVENIEGPVLLANHTIRREYDSNAAWAVNKISNPPWFCLNQRTKALGIVCIQQTDVFEQFSKMATDQVTEKCQQQLQ
ncbi:Plancitoxin-1 [Trichinella patagoniensis]|uniref:Plancitoxin-1 n=1 Tax=Trichinella patagoniensis TaxID=990121 RepID=A0A0V1AAF6_9BILA|nr:Plancitoxin-1 [Trichinella patagoniensis]